MGSSEVGVDPYLGEEAESSATVVGSSETDLGSSYTVVEGF